MKHIKEYNINWYGNHYRDSSGKIEELSEYLQELFDKYKLRELTDVSTSYIGAWIITGGRRGDYPIVFNGSWPIMISITLESDEDFYNMNKDILDKKPNLEKRMGCPIYVRYLDAARRILISTRELFI